MTSIYSQGRARIDGDWQLLFNGSLDRRMYELGLLDQNVPFESLKQRSLVNEIANAAPAEDFGGHVRRELSGYPTPKGAGTFIKG